MSEKTDELGLAHLRRQQIYQGLRVWGCQTIVHFDPDGSIYLVGGQTAPTPTVSTTPALNSDEVVSIAETFLKTKVHDIDLSFEDELLVYPGDSESAGTDREHIESFGGRIIHEFPATGEFICWMAPSQFDLSIERAMHRNHLM